VKKFFPENITCVQCYCGPSGRHMAKPVRRRPGSLRAWKLRRISMDPLKRNGTHVGALYNLFIDSRPPCGAQHLAGWSRTRKDDSNSSPNETAYPVISSIQSFQMLTMLFGSTRVRIGKIEASELQKWWIIQTPKSKCKTSMRRMELSLPLLLTAPRQGDPVMANCGLSTERSADDRSRPCRYESNPPPVHIERLIAGGNNYPFTGKIRLPPIPRMLR